MSRSDDDDLRALALALRSNRTLRRLSVGTAEQCSDGGWTNAGAVAFAGLLAGWNTTLRHLGFGQSMSFDAAGALGLAAALLGSNASLVLHLCPSLLPAGGGGAAGAEQLGLGALPEAFQRRVVGDVPSSGGY